MPPPESGECHWPDCTAECLTTQWACDRHWAVLPIPIRESITRTWDRAKEREGTYTIDYIGVCRSAYRWIELNEGDLREEVVIS